MRNGELTVDVGLRGPGQYPPESLVFGRIPMYLDGQRGQQAPGGGGSTNIPAADRQRRLAEWGSARRRCKWAPPWLREVTEERVDGDVSARGMEVMCGTLCKD